MIHMKKTKVQFYHYIFLRVLLGFAWGGGLGVLSTPTVDPAAPGPAVVAATSDMG